MKIWYRYLFLFFLLSILILYIVIDFSMRGVKIITHDATPLSILINYVNQFAIYFDLFVSIAFLLSSLKVLLDCNRHQELTALQMAGLSKIKLLLPFFTLALFLLFASYANSQWLSPNAGSETTAFKQSISLKKIKKQKVFSLNLEDGSELVYQEFRSQTKELLDVYWIRSNQDIWHMKRLKVDSKPPVAHFLDHLVCNIQGQFEKKESFISQPLPELLWEKQAALQKLIPLENRSLTTLLHQARFSSQGKHAIFSHLYYKLALALFPLLILLQIAPRGFFFSRNQSSFLFVAFALFALLGFTTLLNGMLILAENLVIPPLLAIWGPMGLISSLTIRPLLRLLSI